MFAARNLIAVVALVCLTVGAGAAWAASAELTGEGAGSDLLERPTRSFRKAIERHEALEKRRDARRERRRRNRPEWADAANGGKIEGVPASTLNAIAACESGSDPTSVSSDGTYRGKYQFSTDTWGSVGGSGDPAKAPEAEQDYRAALLYARSGSGQWPVCG